MWFRRLRVEEQNNPPFENQEVHCVLCVQMVQRVLGKWACEFFKAAKESSLKMQEIDPGMYLPSVSYTSSTEFCHLLAY